MSFKGTQEVNMFQRMLHFTREEILTVYIATIALITGKLVKFAFPAQMINWPDLYSRKS
jgi:predicted MFS family arabinose efflux permease